ncbi:BTAD domain-containing putative transcriptional regulator [Kitasatospora sp. NPDC085464]|uniref:AfsR/SARP family transcriptional regulator n=1 Tax=Kitasatospora sp. NPDC085464 TaxID=3364063 RepID=UPI0037C5A176
MACGDRCDDGTGQLGPGRERAVDGGQVCLTVLGGFDLSVGGTTVTVSTGAQRLLAYTALCCRGAVPRALVAGALWPDTAERCAYASLRSALTRLPAAGRRVLEVGPAELRLADGVEVDIRGARTLAGEILAPRATLGRLALGLTAVEDLSADLLPGWYDDWTLLEAESWRRLRIHALEALAGAFVGAGRFPEAVAAAGAAVRADPLRESSQTCLIRAHLAEGNAGEALRDVECYERRLRAELGMPAPARLRRLVAVAAYGGAAGRDS